MIHTDDRLRIQIVILVIDTHSNDKQNQKDIMNIFRCVLYNSCNKLSADAHKHVRSDETLFFKKNKNKGRCDLIYKLITTPASVCLVSLLYLVDNIVLRLGNDVLNLHLVLLYYLKMHHELYMKRRLKLLFVIFSEKRSRLTVTLYLLSFDKRRTDSEKCYDQCEHGIF